MTISDVKLFPQGYAAVLTQSGLLDEPSVIVADIGIADIEVLDIVIPTVVSIAIVPVDI